MTLSRNSIFVDSSAWYAATTDEDQRHQVAASTLAAVLAEGIALATSNHVVGETYTLLRARQGHRAAVAFLDLIASSGRLVRLFTQEEVEAEAYALLRQYADQPFSFVDATSFVWMRRLRLWRAFTFDRHFLTAGFTLIPGQ